MPPKSSADDFLEAQRRDLLAVLGSTVPSGSRVAFLDYPVYTNVGDLMIYLATEHWLETSELEVVGRWNLSDFSFRSLPPDSIILCQGGGNFGDLYPFQRFREKVVRSYPDNRIVFLPQTIHYAREANREISAGILDQHPDLHLLLRDRVSLELATSMAPSCSSALAPDMYLLLYPVEKTLGLARAVSPSSRVLYLLREDIEERLNQPVPECGIGWTGDWRQLLGLRWWSSRLLKAARPVWTVGGPPGAFAHRWHRQAYGLVRHCARRFQTVERVVSSRLHGHLLATLLGIPSILLDNSYGKNSRYFHTWHEGLEIARLQRDKA